MSSTATVPVASTSKEDPPQPGAVKRPAPSDMTEPADKKAKSSVTRTTPSDDALRRPAPSGIIDLMASRFSTPFPMLPTVYVIVNTADMSEYFGTIWDSLVCVIYPDGTFEAANIITRDQFILVCRYLTKSRIDHVYATTSGRRSTVRIAIPREYELPKCLSDLINGIGPITVQGGAATYVPQPEIDPTDPAQRLSTLVNFQMLANFASLVQNARSRNYIRTGLVSTAVQGTAWWMLSARNATNINNLAMNQDSVLVVATFKEWTPADAIYCAIVQRLFDGYHINVDSVLKWATDFITGISSLRASFNLQA